MLLNVIGGKMHLRKIKGVKIKDVIGIVLTVLVITFLLGLIFVPLHNFVVYANFLFGLFLIMVPIYLIFEAYYFIKDAPRRKAGTLPKKKKRKIATMAEWTVRGILILVLLLAKNGSILNQECPETIQGNPDAELIVKYFFNPFCPSCWKQEAIVQETLDEYGGNIRLERYDRRYCMRKGQNLGLRMVPGFVFQFGKETEIYDSLSDEEISEIICEKIECEK